MNPAVIIRLLASTLLGLIGVAAVAGVPTLVRDINTTPIPVSSDPAFLGTVGTTTYFAANDGAHGVELWKTDGTPAGTSLVQDVDAGAGSSSPSNFFAVGALGYFVATSQTSGTRLWVTDGTSAGTHKVTDLAIGSASFTPSVVGAVGTTVLVAGADPSGLHLWATDGTPVGTVLLSDIDFTPRVNPNGFVVASNGRAYYAGFDNVNGIQPWVTDGTPAGTHPLATLTGGPAGPSAASFVQAGNAVYFNAAVDTTGSQLFRISLADDSVTQVSVGVTIEDYSTLSDLPLVPLGNLVVFVGLSGGVEQVWRSDGTAAGTFPLANFSSKVGNSYAPPRFTRVGTRVVFADAAPNTGEMSTDGTVGGTFVLPMQDYLGQQISQAGSYAYIASTHPDGSAIYRTDGTAAGTIAIAMPQGYTTPFALAAMPGITYIAAAGNNPATGQSEFWTVAYDPAANASIILKRATAAPGSLFSVSAGRLYFSVDGPTQGVEPWVSDGTVAGTQLLGDLAPEFTQAGSNPTSFYGFQGELYFSASDGATGQELWRSDGTNAGTRLAADVIAGPLGSAPTTLFAAGSALMFFGYDSVSSSRALWSYNPASSSVQEITSAGPPYTCAAVTPITIQGATYFPAYGLGVEPWRTDGTAAGTSQIADVAQGAGSSNPCQFVSFGGRAYFIAQQFGTQPGYSIWRSDGTDAGTVSIATLGAATSTAPFFLTSYAGALYFIAANTSGVATLWRSDGSASPPIAAASPPQTLGAFVGVVNSRLLFQNTSSTVGQTFWTYDSQTAVFSAITGPNSLAIGSLSENGMLAFFTGTDSARGTGPWVTDGTIAGTRPLVDSQGHFPGSIQWLGDFLNVAIYVGSDSSGTNWYWRSDGTTVGTVQIAALGLGQTISGQSPAGLAAGNYFYFAQSDPTIGTELYALLNDAPVAGNDTATTSSGQSVTINAIANDSDGDGTIDPASVAIVVAPAHGTATPTAHGEFVYVPESGFAGSDTFTYSVRDNQGRAAASAATVTVQVNAASGGSGGGGGGGAVGVADLIALLLLYAGRGIRARAQGGDLKLSKLCTIPR